MGFKSRVVFKFISVVVIFAMFAQDIAYANPSPSLFQSAVFQSFNHSAEDFVIHGKKIQLQSGSGKVIRAFEGQSSAPVFIIQDAHYHLEAQENAASAISQLIEKFDIRMIGVEGAAGEVWHDWATRYPDESVRHSVFRLWLNQHEVNAAEYAAAESKTKAPIRIFGLENAELYQRHLRVDQLVRQNREEMQGRLDAWRRVLRGLISQMMPPAYLNHVTVSQASSGNTAEWMKPLLASAQSQGVDLKNYPQVAIYAELEKGMEKLDGAVLMHEFRKVRDVDLRVGLLQLTLKLSPSAVENIQAKLTERGLSQSSPNLMAWIKLLGLTPKLNENLISEFKALDSDLRRSYLNTPQQIWLDQLSRWTDLMDAWQRLEWAPEDAARYERDHARFLSDETLSKVLELSKHYRVETTDQKWQALFDANTWAPWLEFYVLALKRDAQLAANTQKILKIAGSKPVLIYAGGFHTPGLERALKSQSISYVTIRPAIRREQDVSEKAAYERALDGHGGFFEKFLKQSVIAANRRSQRIPFELATPDSFPTLGDNVPQGSQAVFEHGGLSLFTFATLVSGNTSFEKLNFSELTVPSQTAWSNVHVESQENQGATGLVTLTTGLGVTDFRWKRHSAHSGHGWQTLDDIDFRLSGQLDPQYLASAVVNTVSAANEGTSFGNLLPSGLLASERETGLVRSEVRAPKPTEKIEKPVIERRPTFIKRVFGHFQFLFFALAGLIAFSASAVAAPKKESAKSKAAAAEVAREKNSEKVKTGLKKLGVSFFQRGRVKDQVVSGKTQVTVRKSILGLPIGAREFKHVSPSLRAGIKLEQAKENGGEVKSSSQSASVKKKTVTASRTKSASPKVASKKMPQTRGNQRVVAVHGTNSGKQADFIDPLQPVAPVVANNPTTVFSRAAQQFVLPPATIPAKQNPVTQFLNTYVAPFVLSPNRAASSPVKASEQTMLGSVSAPEELPLIPVSAFAKLGNLPRSSLPLDFVPVPKLSLPPTTVISHSSVAVPQLATQVEAVAPETKPSGWLQKMMANETQARLTAMQHQQEAERLAAAEQQKKLEEAAKLAADEKLELQKQVAARQLEESERIKSEKAAELARLEAELVKRELERQSAAKVANPQPESPGESRWSKFAGFFSDKYNTWIYFPATKGIKFVDSKIDQIDFLNNHPRLKSWIAFWPVAAWLILTTMFGWIYFKIFHRKTTTAPIGISTNAASVAQIPASALEKGLFLGQLPSLQAGLEGWSADEVDSLRAAIEAKFDTDTESQIYEEAVPQNGGSLFQYLYRLYDLIGEKRREESPVASAAGNFSSRNSWKMWVWPAFEMVGGLSVIFLLGINSLIVLKAIVAFRLAWTGTFILNEWGHTIMSLLVGKPDLSLKNWLGGKSVWHWIASVTPGMPLILGAFTHFIDAGKWRMSLIRWFGWAFSTGIAGWAVLTLFPEIKALWLVPTLELVSNWQNYFNASMLNHWIQSPVLFFSAGIVIIWSFFKDILFPPADPHKACCGNEDQVLDLSDVDPNEKSAYFAEELFIMEQIDAITQVRGGQAKGGRIYLKTKDGKTILLDIKILVGRRRSVSEEWRREVQKGIKKILRNLKNADSVSFHMHIRFGTSSRPAIIETHPFVFDKPMAVDYRYQDSEGNWQTKRVENFQNLASANGDNDFFAYFEDGIGTLKGLDHTQQGMWLESVLDIDNATLGDSPKLAGLLDLLHTKGMWHASFRLAFQDAAGRSFEAAFKNGKLSKDPANRAAPTRKQIAEFTQAWEAHFSQQIARHPKAGQDQIQGWVKDFILRSQTSNQFSFAKRIPADRIESFAARATEVFAWNDLYSAVLIIQKRGSGSYGFVASDTLDPAGVVFAGFLQPLSIAFHESGQRYVVLSEKLAAQVKLPDGKPAYTGRYDLEQTKGQILAIDKGTDGKFRIRGINLTGAKELTDAEVRQSGRFIPLTGNPNLQTIPDNILDPDSWIPENLRLMAFHFKLLDNSWVSEGGESENQLSGEALWNLMRLQWIESQLMEFSVGPGNKFSADSHDMNMFVKAQVGMIGQKLEAGKLNQKNLKSEIALAQKKILAEQVEKNERDAERASKKVKRAKKAEEVQSHFVLPVKPAKNSQPVKMVLVGVENSEDTSRLGTKLMELKFGNYDAVSVDGNVLLEAFNNKHLDGSPIRVGADDSRSFYVDENTIYIFTTSTGQQFASVNDAAAAKDMEKIEMQLRHQTQMMNLREYSRGRVFGMANKDTVLAGILGQKSHLHAKWVNRLFLPFPGEDNISFHPSEVATVALQVQNRSMAHLVLFLSLQAAEMGDMHPFGFDASKGEIEKDRTALLKSVSEFGQYVGYDTEGKPLKDQRRHREIKNSMDETRSHIFESPLKWLVGKFYPFLILVVGAVIVYYKHDNIFLPSGWFAAPGSLLAAILYGSINFIVVAAVPYIAVFSYRLVRSILKAMIQNWAQIKTNSLQAFVWSFSKWFFKLIFRADFSRLLVSQTLPGVALVESPLNIRIIWQFWNKLFSDAPSIVRVFAQRLSHTEAAHYGPPMVNTASHVVNTIPDGKLLGLWQRAKASELFGKQADGIASLPFRFLERWFGLARISPNIMTITQDSGKRLAGQKNLVIHNDLAKEVSVHAEFVQSLREHLKISDAAAESIRKAFDDMRFQNQFYDAQVTEARRLVREILSAELKNGNLYAAETLTADYFERQRDHILFFEFAVAGQLRITTFYVAAFDVASKIRKSTYNIFRAVASPFVNLGKWLFGTASKIRAATTASTQSGAPVAAAIRRLLQATGIVLDENEPEYYYHGSLPFTVVTQDESSFREFMFSRPAAQAKKQKTPPLKSNFTLVRLALKMGQPRLAEAQRSGQGIAELIAWQSQDLLPLTEQINDEILKPSNLDEKRLVEELLALQTAILKLSKPAALSGPAASVQGKSNFSMAHVRLAVSLGKKRLDTVRKTGQGAAELLQWSETSLAPRAEEIVEGKISTSGEADHKTIEELSALQADISALSPHKKAVIKHVEVDAEDLAEQLRQGVNKELAFDGKIEPNADLEKEVAALEARVSGLNGDLGAFGLKLLELAPRFQHDGVDVMVRQKFGTLRMTIAEKLQVLAEAEGELLRQFLPPENVESPNLIGKRRRTDMGRSSKIVRPKLPSGTNPKQERVSKVLAVLKQTKVAGNEKAPPKAPQKKKKGDSGKNRSEFRDLSAALSESASVASELETARLQKLLAQLPSVDFGASSFAQTSGYVLLVNPDALLIQSMASSSPNKKLVLYFDKDSEVKVVALKQQLPSVNAKWILQSQSGPLDAYVRFMKGNQRIDANEVVEVRASSAMNSLSVEQQAMRVAQLLGSTPEALVVYGNRGAPLAGVRNLSIVDVLENFVMSARRFSTQA